MSENNYNTENIKEKYIKELDTDFRYSIEKFDTQIIYISSGALAISLTFLEKMVPIKEAVWLILYYCAIVFFGLTILLGFFGHYLSSNQIDKRIKDIENDSLDPESKDYIGIINTIIIIFLLIGVTSLITFTIVNMINLNNKLR